MLAIVWQKLTRCQLGLWFSGGKVEYRCSHWLKSAWKPFFIFQIGWHWELSTGKTRCLFARSAKKCGRYSYKSGDSLSFSSQNRPRHLLRPGPESSGKRFKNHDICTSFPSRSIRRWKASTAVKDSLAIEKYWSSAIPRLEKMNVYNFSCFTIGVCDITVNEKIRRKCCGITDLQ